MLLKRCLLVLLTLAPVIAAAAVPVPNVTVANTPSNPVNVAVTNTVTVGNLESSPVPVKVKPGALYVARVAVDVAGDNTAWSGVFSPEPSGPVVIDAVAAWCYAPEGQSPGEVSVGASFADLSFWNGTYLLFAHATAQSHIAGKHLWVAPSAPVKIYAYSEASAYSPLQAVVYRNTTAGGDMSCDFIVWGRYE